MKNFTAGIVKIGGRILSVLDFMLIDIMGAIMIVQMMIVAVLAGFKMASLVTKPEPQYVLQALVPVAGIYLAWQFAIMLVDLSRSFARRLDKAPKIPTETMPEA